MSATKLIPKPPQPPDAKPRIVSARAPRIGPSRTDDERARAPTIVDHFPVAPGDEDATGELVDE